MDKFPKFILLTNIHGLNIWIIFMLVQNASETAFHFGGGMQLEDAVVQQSRKSLGEIWETGGDWLGLLEVQVPVLGHS